MKIQWVDNLLTVFASEQNVGEPSILSRNVAGAFLFLLLMGEFSHMLR